MDGTRAPGALSMVTPAASTMPGTAPPSTAGVNEDVALELVVASRACRTARPRSAGRPGTPRNADDPKRERSGGKGEGTPSRSIWLIAQELTHRPAIRSDPGGSPWDGTHVQLRSVPGAGYRFTIRIRLICATVEHLSGAAVAFRMIDLRKGLKTAMTALW